MPHENIETLHLANKVKEPEVIEEIEEAQEPVEAVENEEHEETEDNVEEEAEEIEEHVEAEPELNQEAEEVTEETEEEEEKVEELPLPPLPDELEDDEVFDETSFSDPLEAIQMLEGDDDEDTSIISEDEDGFTFDNSVETDDEVK